MYIKPADPGEVRKPDPPSSAEPAIPAPSPGDAQAVRIVDVSIPLESMLRLMLKGVLALILVSAFFAAIGGIILLMFGVIR